MVKMRSAKISLAGLTAWVSFFPSSTSSLNAPSMQKIFQFPFPTWIENIAIRPNNQLLVSLLTSPELHLVDPAASPPSSQLIHSFRGTNITGILGIAELSHDKFAFIAAAIPATNTPSNCSVWEADFNRDPPAVSKIADVPSGQLLNGLAKLNDRTLLMSDARAGHVLSLDVQTGISKTFLQDASMQPATVDGVFAKSGVNGLKVWDSYVYYTNSATGSLHRVRVDCEMGEAKGRFETIAAGMPDADDIAVQRDGTAYVAAFSGNFVERVEASGGQSVLAGSLNSSSIPGPTAAALGRGVGEGVLYVVTNGGWKNPVNGTFREGGSVIAVGLR